jgi:isoleucyl-tRNA synthetase
MGKFKLADDKKRIPELEEETIKFWKDNRIFEKSVEQRPEDDLYVFYDGPPFISGLPHYGHLLGSIAKDIIPRYWTMKGKRVERVWGWDAHGLTVENRVQEKLGIKKRRDIEKYGVEEFTKACYKYTSETSAEWDWYVDRIGRWVDLKNAYKTTDQNYMESVMWAFKELYIEGHIYEGMRTSLYCTTCGTPVSNFEIAMDDSYKDVEDPSITVGFEVVSKGRFDGAYILAWTTTPWTLPSNRALVVDPEAVYVVVEFESGKYILAESRLDNVFDGKEYVKTDEFLGKDLLDLRYKPLYEFFKAKENEFKVYSYEGMVHMEEGAGVVHSAPGFGEIDTEMGKHYDLTIMLTIDDEGNFYPGNNKKNPYEGMFYKDTDNPIREDLSKRGLLFKDEKVVHRFPYHDRCNTLLVQKAQDSWFVNVQDAKKEMLKYNENINWVPNHIKLGWYKKIVEQAPDWCISRNRFWATPMPVWEAEDGDRIVVSSIEEIESLSGQKVIDLHRPYIDKITFEKNGKIYKRRPEVLDSWMEAGSMPYAQMHYPFENQKKFEDNFPGDFISEYTGQVRAWFNFLHILSTMLFKSHSFKNVIVSGVLAGSDGRKMSKTYQNYPDPKGVLENIGGDALRLYFMNSPLMLAENANFSETELKTKLNNVINPLWNSLKFFLIYAVSHDWSAYGNEESENELDTWIRVRLHQTIKEFTENIEEYIVPKAVQSLEDFVDDLSRWYVRRSRERIVAGDKEALSTLHEVLVTFSKLAAPVIPFSAERMYRHLVVDPETSDTESVHLCEFPAYDDEFINKNKYLIEKMHTTREIVSLALSIRASNKIKVRQPLSDLFVEFTGRDPLFDPELIKQEVNVKEVNFGKPDKDYESIDLGNIKVYINTNLTDELLLEGAFRELVRQIQDLRKKQKLYVDDKIKVYYADDEIISRVIDNYKDEISLKVNASEFVLSDSFGIELID